MIRKPPAYVVASGLKRFLNHLIDFIFILIILIVSDIIIYVIGVPDSLYFFINVIIMVDYYVMFEAFLGKTIAKFITGTRVILENGGRPGFGTIVIRTLCRFIPFEALSFLTEHPVGWHDSISNTRVIDNDALAVNANITGADQALDQTRPEQNSYAYQGGNAATPAQTSGAALASLICGLVGLITCLPAIPAIILGIIGLVNIKKGRGALKGSGMAIAGLILAGLTIMLWLIIIIVAIAIPQTM